MFASRFMPCPRCGASVERSEQSLHECDSDRALDHEMFRRRAEVEKFETHLREYLASTTGRFQVWLCARQVRGQY